MDSIPMIAITGQVGTAALGTDAFQECDTTGITMAVTKHNFLVTEAQDIPTVVREAFHIATTGRPGPVLIDVPKDIVDPMNPRSAMEWYWPERVDLPGYHPITTVDRDAVRRAAELILASERPVIYAGGGILKARAAEALKELAELCDIHVVTTLMARGAFPDSHRLALGMPGMHGNYTAVTSMQRSDLLIALGARFDDRVTGKVPAFAPEAKIIHVDVDPAELGKVRRPDVGIAGDAKATIEALVEAIKELGGGKAQPDRQAWKSQVSGWQEKFPLTYQQSEPGELLKPQFVLEQLRDNTPDDCIVASGVGQHQMWTSQYWKFDHPYTWVNSGGLGTMGFAVPAAIGAKVGRPDRMVWAVDGDGCFQMTAQELVTAASERIPVKIAILNNAYLGMVRQWQEMFYDERYSEVYLSPDLPDYKMWAEAMGCIGMRVESPEEVLPAIEKANEIDDRPVVIDFRTDSREKVYPMVPAGASNDQIVTDPAHGEGGR
jgi:acetolactate synthase-1/2/3 large subunit